MAKRKLTFETALDKLEQTANALETDELTLDESLKKFEEGVGYMRICEEKLKDSEGKLQELLDGSDGKLVEKILGINSELIDNGEI